MEYFDKYYRFDSLKTHPNLLPPSVFFYIKDRIHKLPDLLGARGAQVHGKSWKKTLFSK